MIPKLKSRQAPKGAEGNVAGTDGNVGGSSSKKKNNKKGKRK